MGPVTLALALMVVIATAQPMWPHTPWLLVPPPLPLVPPPKPLAPGNGILRTAKESFALAHQPLAQAVVNFFSSQCSELKTLLGVEFHQVQEPNVDLLTLNFQYGGIQASFQLGTVVQSMKNIAGINLAQPLVIYMHGFTDKTTFYSFPIVNEAFQSTGKYNVLGLDASPLIGRYYLRSSTYARHAGRKLGAALVDMMNAGLDPQNIYLVGHSLGSQISAFAGKTFHQLSGRLVGRITGLDPAGPCFSHVDEDLRLKASDAAFVDVIHTNGGVLGIREPIGHADFYPNGGELQPNCMTQYCSHLRVVELFAQSIRNPGAFPARHCASWNAFETGQCSGEVSQMGYGCDKNARGSFYLRTGGSPPYELGAEGRGGPGTSTMGRFFGAVAGFGPHFRTINVGR